jgi:hypothetical protein
MGRIASRRVHGVDGAGVRRLIHPGGEIPRGVSVDEADVVPRRQVPEQALLERRLAERKGKKTT